MKESRVAINTGIVIIISIVGGVVVTLPEDTMAFPASVAVRVTKKTTIKRCVDAAVAARRLRAVIIVTVLVRATLCVHDSLTKY